jgi:hypothetical protein
MLKTLDTARSALWMMLVAGTVAGCGVESEPECGADAPCDTEADLGKGDGATTRRPLRLVQANVGNVALTCSPYEYKLCYAETEARIRDNLAKHDADVITLQEVTAPWQCTAVSETSPDKVCHPSRYADVVQQVRRLVGSKYSIACDVRNQYDCIAVHERFGSIDRCAGSVPCINAGRTAPMAAGCDDGFTVAAFTVRPAAARAFTLVNAHPPSGSAAACRRQQFEQLFAGPTPLAGASRALLSGDFNMDPYHGNDESVTYWKRYAGAGKRFAYHSGIAEANPPYKTATYVIGDHVYDHVASDFARGTCKTLGFAPGTTRLDGGSGTDHRALLCDLTID